jgi:hypothetical protein
MYAYIPDASLVGTVFSNFISNALATAVPSIEFAVVCKDCELTRFHNLTMAPQGDSPVKKVSLRNLHFGQSKDVMMTITIADANSAIIVRVTAADGSFKDLRLNSWGNFEIVMFSQQKARNLFIEKMSQALLLPAGSIAESQGIVRDLLTALPAADVHPSISALRRDIVGLSLSQVPCARSFAPRVQQLQRPWRPSVWRGHVQAAAGGGRHVVRLHACPRSHSRLSEHWSKLLLQLSIQRVFLFRSCPRSCPCADGPLHGPIWRLLAPQRPRPSAQRHQQTRPNTSSG